MPKSLPKTVIVGGTEFSVELVKTLEHDELGTCDVIARKIKICSNQSLKEREKTLFHETVHAALRLGGIAEILKEDAEEAVCWNLESLLWPILEFKK